MQLSDKRGFTLLELMAVMVILGVIVSVGIKRTMLVDETSRKRALTIGVKELNIREQLVWIDLKLSDIGYANDANLFSKVDLFLGAEYSWKSAPKVTGGVMIFDGTELSLARQISTSKKPGEWKE